MARAKRYKVEVNNGQEHRILDVPDRCAGPDERISVHGMPAIIARTKRNRAFKQLNAVTEWAIGTIILPNGERVSC